MNNRVTPDSLELSKRFDIFIKLIYAKESLKNELSQWAKDAYLEHINVFNGFSEPDRSGKNSPEMFLKNFNHLIKSMNASGFDSEYGLIPVDLNKVPQNGAHRLSSAIALGIDVETEDTNSEGFTYDFKFFRKNGLPEVVMDAAALEFIKYNADSTVFITYPVSKKYYQDIDHLFQQQSKVFYYKDLTLSSLGSINAIQTIYQNEPWLGNIDNDFYGARSKAHDCFGDSGGIVRVYLASTSADNALKLKELIREKVKLGKHSIHCSDSQEEALLLGELFFNNNSIHSVNYSELSAFQNHLDDLKKFKAWLKTHNIKENSICVNGGSVLSSYGLRETSDVDFIHLDDVSKIPTNHCFDSHNKDSFLFGLPVSEIILNPNHHFYFNGIRHVSLPLLKAFKQARGEPKDFDDIKLINAVSKANPSKNKLKLKYRLRIIARKLKFKLKRIRDHLTKRS